MRAKRAKQIRRDIGYDPKNPNPVLKKNYKRAKKTYNSLDRLERVEYIKSLTN